MDEALQTQLSVLQGQMNDLHHTVEQMPEQLSSILATFKETAKQPVASRLSQRYAQVEDDYAFLLDEESATPSRGMNLEIAPEAQVQRLTAQLTAAYNRIAALEEQLLAQRLHQ